MQMHSFALTGGIATGKSTFGRILKELRPEAVLFDCDAAVHRLLGEEEVASLIVKALGSAVTVGGVLDREKLREVIFADERPRRTLEGVLHPRVREECLEMQRETAINGVSSLFVADVPLLFESGFDFGYERSLLVATTRETQLARLKSRNGFDNTLAEAILATQIPILEKLRRADVVFWNEGSEEVLRHQISRFLQTLESMAAKKKTTKKKTAAKKSVVKKKAAKKAARKAAPKKKAAKTESKVKAEPRAEAKGKDEIPEEEVTPLVEESEGLVKTSGGKDADPAPSEAVASEASDPAPALVPEKDREPEPEPTFDVPEQIDVNEFRERSLAKLLDLAAEYPIRATGALGKRALIFDLLSFCSTHGTVLEAEGILEQAKENYAMLRDPKRSFRTAPDDFYVGGNLLKQHGLRAGQKVKVRLRAPRERDKYLSALEILTIEGNPPEEFETEKDFDQLTSLFPEDRFVLERPGEDALAVRLIDIVAPIGKGQRALIVAPPRGGKTILLKEIAKSIAANHRESKLIILLLDERPEEVTDFEETVDADVFSSTFDEPAKRHAQVSDLVLERARRLVELGQDVVILLDSLTRLARGYNNSQRGGGPIGSGGLSPNALQKSRKFFGAARNLEEGGSLTIVATCLIETESRMDDIIFEELKGTGNMEIRLDRELAESRIFPAVHIPQSGTRNDDRLYHPQEMEKVIEIRRQLTTLPIGEALETLLRQLAKNSTNAELLMRGII